QAGQVGGREVEAPGKVGLADLESGAASHVLRHHAEDDAVEQRLVEVVVVVANDLDAFAPYPVCELEGAAADGVVVDGVGQWICALVEVLGQYRGVEHRQQADERRVRLAEGDDDGAGVGRRDRRDLVVGGYEAPVVRGQDVGHAEDDVGTGDGGAIVEVRGA